MLFLSESMFLAALLIIGAGIVGYWHAKRYGRDSGANAMWIILFVGFLFAALVKSWGVARYPQHTAIFRELDDMLFWVTILVVISWLLGAIIGTRKPKADSAIQKQA